MRPPPGTPANLLGHHDADAGDAAGVAPHGVRFDFARIPVHAPPPLASPSMLPVTPRGDRHEAEAERVAHHVLTRPVAPAVSAAPSSIQRFSPSASREMKAAPPSVDRVLAGAGRPLERPVREDMEARFRQDFSHVRVHSDPAAAHSARDVHAHAYTAGHHIVFGSNRFAPATHEGRRLLAHELTHVVQQSALPQGAGAIQRDADQDLTDDRVRDLKAYVAANPAPYKHVIEVIRFSKSQDLDDNVSADFVESLSSSQLEQYASTRQGREMLDVMYGAMMTGHVTSHERLQADRIVYAKWRFRPAEVFKAAELYDPDASVNPLVIAARTRADTLNQRAAAKRYRDVVAGVRENSAIEDDIAARFLTLQSPARLDAYAATDEGRAMLDVLYDALITGDVTKFERLQADRILDAKNRAIRAPAAADVKKAVTEPAIFPLATSWDSTATIRAELLPNGKVKVYYDSRTGLRSKEFARERATLYERYGESAVFNGIVFDPDEPVIVKLFDQGGATVTVPAIRFIDFFNQQKEDTLGKIKAVSMMGATVGLGGVGAGGILGWADTIAFAINAGNLFINANRDVIRKTALGRRFLDAWDVANGIVEYYNWARLGVDGLRLVHAKVSGPFKRWRQEVPEGVTSAEQQTIGQAQQQTEAWLDAVKKAEAAEAAKLADTTQGAQAAKATGAAKTVAAPRPGEAPQATAAPKATPAGSPARTNYSRTPPRDELDVAAAAGGTRRRVSGIDRGKGARPRYANDPVKPKVTGTPGGGEGGGAGAPFTPIPGHSGRDVLENYPAKKHVFEGDIEGGYHSTARGPTDRIKVLKYRKKPAAPGDTYKIKVQISEGGQVVKVKDSTMFPNNLTEQQVLDEVYDVMLHNAPTSGPKGYSIQGVSRGGYHILIALGRTGEALVSFFPTK